MTVAMERRHGGPVGLRVVAELSADAGEAAGDWYAREILLLGPSGAVVQHGIVRIDLNAVGPAVAAAIRAGKIPLGRILIDAGLLLEVQRVGLVAVEPGPHLAALFAGATGPAYGRVAEIVVNGRPAVELLEIVAPA
jgi:chorismate-pyruvate lyase